MLKKIALTESKTNSIMLILATIIVSILWSTLIKTADSSSTDNLSGYAWSDTIGWISFNCTNPGTCATSPYGVKVSSAGALSGYAWSEHIGWISFNAADVSGCPSGTCAPSFNKTTGVVTGWAKALAGGAGGWDGFISLSGAGYGVTTTGCSWSGYAWGSTVVGWVSFSGAGYGVTGTGDACKGNPPAVTFTASPSTINSGGLSILTWTVTGAADLCTATGGWSGSKLVTGGTEVVSPLTTTTYNLECWNAGVSSGIKTVTITTLASCPAGTAKSWTVGGNTCTANTPAVSSGANGTLTDSIAPNMGTAAYLCTNGTWAATPIAGATCNIPPELTVDEPLVVQDTDAVLRYYPNGQICTLTGGELNISNLSADGTESVKVVGRTTYTLSCPSGSDSVTVEVIPRGFET